jgi:hypothetical protein
MSAPVQVAAITPNKITLETEKKDKNPSTKMSLKTLLLSKKKSNHGKTEEKLNQTPSQSKTSSSKSKSDQEISKSEESLSQSEKQMSKSEESLSQSHSRPPFSKFNRALDLAQSKADVQLDDATIKQTLNDLKRKGSISWYRKGNSINGKKIRPKDKLEQEDQTQGKKVQKVKLTLHTHDKSDKEWNEKAENVAHFLWFIGECDEGLKELIKEKSEKKPLKKP